MAAKWAGEKAAKWAGKTVELLDATMAAETVDVMVAWMEN